MAVSIEQFAQVELRTAEVLEAERVAGTDRLVRLIVSLGAETRGIVAGIGAQYEPEDLVGRTVVVVANLQPAMIRGVESQGMLLAAAYEGRLALVTTDAPLPPGSVVR